MTAPRPGWYPDPAGATQLYRWWDGETWTDHVGDSAQRPAPEPAPAASAASAEPAHLPPELQPDPDEPVPPRGRRSATRTVLAVTVGFALFVSAGAGAGMLIWHDTAGSSSGATATRATRAAPRTAATGSATPAVGRLDQSSRQAHIGRATMTLPPAPYRTNPDPQALPGVFDVYFTAGSVVHERYDSRHDWSAIVALAQLSPQLVTAGTSSTRDLEETGERALVVLAGRFFAGHATTVEPVAYSDRSVDGNPGLLFTVAVHYTVKGLPSRHDRVTALVVRLDDGSLVVAVSSVPNDAAPDVVTLAADSLDSLTIS